MRTIPNERRPALLVRRSAIRAVRRRRLLWDLRRRAHWAQEARLALSVEDLTELMVGPQ